MPDPVDTEVSVFSHIVSAARSQQHQNTPFYRQNHGVVSVFDQMRCCEELSVGYSPWWRICRVAWAWDEVTVVFVDVDRRCLGCV